VSLVSHNIAAQLCSPKCGVVLGGRGISATVVLVPEATMHE